MRPSGWAGFLALFAILCTIFSTVVTVVEYPQHPERLHDNLVIVAVSLIAAAALRALAHHLRRHEAEEPPAPSQPGTPSLPMGIFVSVVGIAILGAALYRMATTTQPPAPDAFLVFPTALIFVFMGVLLALPPQFARGRLVVGALLMTAFAITFDWIAFGPGERHFSGGFSVGPVGVGSNPGELFGRIVFGLPAAMMTIGALVLWVRSIRGG